MKKLSLLSLALLSVGSITWMLTAEEGKVCTSSKACSKETKAECEVKKAECEKKMASMTAEEKAECKSKCDAWAKKTAEEKSACQTKCDAAKAECTKE
jgi:hypothetical protein